MAKYNNQYAMKVKAATPNLRGLDTNYDNTGQKNLKGIGLGDLFQLDYDRNKIEQIFNQGTDAQYALMQKENQIAQNNFVNNQFQQQQSTMEALRQQRNDQISSGMAKGLAAAQEQGTILGLQQENSQAALDLANQQQTEADKIAAEYAQNVADALKEANSVKEAIAKVSAQLYEADMLGYTGELSYLGQMDANASNRYGSELGLEGTKYQANKQLEGDKYTANKNLEAQKYYSNAYLSAAKANAAATRDAATISANATKYAANKNAAAYSSSNGGSGITDRVDYPSIIKKNTNSKGEVNWSGVKGDLVGNGIKIDEAENLITSTRTDSAKQKEGITSINNTDQWFHALNGRDNALKALDVKINGGYNSNFNDNDCKKAVAEAYRQINNGEYTFIDNQTLMNDLVNGKFGKLGWGF